ncbi:MAG: diguanylate cyclase [Chloroflexi bacterium]|nr:diguanylate cyclase [Chloroflexota bacterium]MBU1750249.1 diguanylate cyclase [Chloroflexota bacterium]MBU1878520.1 diguanylate cyclase [Chloroflexota bacterium]
MKAPPATRVLIAEDSTLIRQGLRSILEEQGYVVVGEAQNGRQAVDLAHSLRPDAILMDLDMPEMNGLEATRQIQSTCPTPVVVLTVHDSPEVVQQASAAGAGAYLVKPPDPQELERALIVATARFADMIELRRLNAMLQVRLTEGEQMAEQLRYESTHDNLTGVYNRAYLEAQLAQWGSEQSFPVSVVVADVDGLKMVNDTLGHAAGDDLLCRTALVLKQTFRLQDVIARTGGDEFVVLLPGADAAVANQAPARIRHALANHNSQQPGPPLSLSVGVATGGLGLPLAEALKLADQRMYQEKSARPHRSPARA